MVTNTQWCLHSNPGHGYQHTVVSSQQPWPWLPSHSGVFTATLAMVTITQWCLHSNPGHGYQHTVVSSQQPRPRLPTHISICGCYGHIWACVSCRTSARQIITKPSLSEHGLGNCRFHTDQTQDYVLECSPTQNMLTENMTASSRYAYHDFELNDRPQDTLRFSGTVLDVF